MLLPRMCTHLLLPFMLIAGTGCAALTRTEIAEVGKFAAAAKRYSDLPGAVIARHAEIRRDRQVLRVVTFRNGTTARSGIESALRTDAGLKEKGRQADQALQVLGDYANLLSLLTADSYTATLQSNAELLAHQVDRGIEQYNRTTHASLGAAGSTVAALVRGAGGVFVRHRQARTLREVVAAADPLVASLTGAVQELMALYLDGDQLAQLADQKGGAGGRLVPAGLLTQEKRDVAHFYQGVAGQYQGRQPPELPLKVAHIMQSSDDAALLAAKAFQAAAKYRAAHEALARAITQRSTLSALEEIRALADEVDKAQLLKKKLDRK